MIRYRALCSCGWLSPEAETEDEALEEHSAHFGETGETHGDHVSEIAEVIVARGVDPLVRDVTEEIVTGAAIELEKMSDHDVATLAVQIVHRLPEVTIDDWAELGIATITVDELGDRWMHLDPNGVRVFSLVLASAVKRA